MSSVISVGIHDLIDGELVLGVKDLRNHGKGCFSLMFCLWLDVPQMGIGLHFGRGDVHWFSCVFGRHSFKIGVGGLMPLQLFCTKVMLGMGLMMMIVLGCVEGRKIASLLIGFTYFLVLNFLRRQQRSSFCLLAIWSASNTILVACALV